MMEWILSSSALILVVVLLRRVLQGKISLRLQYALWGLVLLRLLMPFSLADSSISLMNAVEKVETVQTVESVKYYERVWQNDSGAVSGMPNRGILPDPELIKPEVTQEEFQLMQRAITLREGLKFVWIAGMAVCFAVFALSNRRFRREAEKGRRPLEARSPVPIFVSDRVSTPCLYGFWEPVIYVTPEAAENETLMRHVLAHEQTHYRHGDNIWAILRCLCLVIHWYNPLVWLAAALSRRDCELACDESTIRHIGEEQRSDYGRTLIAMTVSPSRRGEIFSCATTMTGSRKSIRERIVLIAKKPKTAVYTLVAVILITALAVGCTFTGADRRQEDGGKVQDDQTAVSPIPDEAGLPIGIEKEIADLPQPVLEWAKEIVARDIAYHNSLGDYRITAARIINMERMNVDALQTDGYGAELYSLEYRLQPDEPENVVLAGGMRMEEDWITESSSAGKPYLLMLRSEDGDKWQRVCVTNDEVLGVEYSKPEMLDQYGDCYTAFCAENISMSLMLYRELEPDTLSVFVPLSSFFQPGPITDPEIVNTLYDAFCSISTVHPTVFTKDAVWSYELYFSNSKTGTGMQLGIHENGVLSIYREGEQSISYYQVPNGEELYELVGYYYELVRQPEVYAPEEIYELTSAKLQTDEWPYTVFDEEALHYLEEALGSAMEIGFATKCGFGRTLILTRADGKSFACSLATDSCGVVKAGERYYEFASGNEKLLSLFFTPSIRGMDVNGFRPDLMWYIDWSRFANTYGSEPTMRVVDMAYNWVKAADGDELGSRMQSYMSWTYGLDGAYSDYYAQKLSLIYELDKAEFAWRCLNNIMDTQEEEIIGFLAYAKGISYDAMRSELEAFLT